MSLPPGPRVPAPLLTWAWLTRPTSVFDRCAERYGELFTLRLAVLGTHVYVADPALVRAVFTGDPKALHAGEAYQIMEPVSGPSSLFLLDESEHLRMRKLLLAPLHGDRLERWREEIADVTEREVGSWPLGAAFPLRPSTEAITLELIMRIVFGMSSGSRRANELRRLLPRLFAVTLLQAPAFIHPAFRQDLGRRSPWGRFVRLRARIDELLYQEIAERRAELAGASESEREDVLSRLLCVTDEEGEPLSDRELRDQLITMLLAGHETTASSLSWAFERLLRHPAALGRLREELEAGETGYLQAVIKETLRSRPVGAHVARKLTEPLALGGYDLDPGTIVAISIYLLHHSPRMFEAPREFRPERFLEGQPASYAWIPFGGGVRRCIGSGLATLEMEVVISTILRLVELRPSRPEPEAFSVLGVTLVPSRGGEVVVEQRRDGDASPARSPSARRPAMPAPRS